MNRAILRGLVVLPLLLAPCLAAAQALDAAERLAIVVGNAAYPAESLANPLNDARAVTGSLRELGFETMRLENGTRADFKLLVERLPKSLRPNSVVVFYYAGHAVQYRGRNYLIPVDFRIEAPEDLPETSLELGEVLQAIERAGVGLTIVVLDACRNYPFGALADAFGDGLASIATTGETIVAYATAAGEVALDGLGPNSPYTSALIAALEMPGRDIYDVFRLVRAKVREATNGRQIPWITGSIETDLVLRPAPDPGRPALVPAAFDAADVHWGAIAASADPADFERFAQAHPQTPVAAQARDRRQELLLAGLEPIPALAVAVETLPAPAGRSLAITPCDRWAADPDDPERLTDGVPWGLVNTRQAIRDCAAALEAEPDSPRLNFMLGRALDVAERFGEAAFFYRKAAAAGHMAAMYNLAFMHRTGRGMAPDDTAAAQLYLDAATRGSPNARKAVAKLYEEGWGVPRSEGEMLRWLRLAAADGHARSMDHLGNLYRAGKAVPQDYGRALQLYTTAAGLGNSNALANLARLHRDGTGVAKDLARAAELYRRATELGNPFAPYHLSQIYLEGAEGVPRDPDEARRLLELSADRGYEWAFWRLARWYEAPAAGAPDRERALYNYLLAVEAGEALRHPSGDQLAAEAGERAQALRAELPPDVVAAAEARARTWLAQNSLFRFALVYPY